MKSMTGFGHGKNISNGILVSVEIATVNRRHAELVFNLPRELSSMEGPLRDAIAPAITRGRATINVAISSGDKSTQNLLDHQLLSRLHSELNQLQASLKISAPPTISDLIRLYTSSCTQSSNSQFLPPVEVVIHAAQNAVETLHSMREKEGKHLAKELSRLLRNFSAEISTITKLAPKVPEQYLKNLRSRLSALNAEFIDHDDRLARELAIFADRSDITEEISRLASHIQQFKTSLTSDTPTGRTLDFLTQEMFRECNTIGSKANDAQISRHIISAKTELERIREQVQNVE